MGVQILQGDPNLSKHQMVKSTVVAGSFAAPGSQDCIVWVGSTALATKNQVEIITALKRCRDGIIEEGCPNPAAESEVTALCIPGEGKPAVAVTNQAALPTIAETDVVISYGNNFINAGATKIFVDRVNAAIDKFIEDELKSS